MDTYLGNQGVTAAGTSGLGSESDYAITSSGAYEQFGNDYYEANNTHALTAYYFWWYSPNSGDYYYGAVYDNGSYGYHVGEVAYGPYSSTESSSGDGYYYIYNSADAAGSGYAAGDVKVGSVYYDGDTGTSMYTYYGYYGDVTGTAGLGSEYDYAITDSGTYDYFGNDYYEANNTGTSLVYYYAYDLASGDYQWGFTYDDGSYGYYAGESWYTSDENGSYWYYYVSDLTSGYSGTSGYNYLYQYYDGETGTYATPVPLLLWLRGRHQRHRLRLRLGLSRQCLLGVLQLL